MSQGVRDMLSNRRFAIPLIILLAFCFIGLLMIGIVLIFRPGDGDDVAEITETATVAVTDTREPTDTLPPTNTPTRSPTATRVLGGTPTDGAEGEPTPTSTEAAVIVTSVAGETQTVEPTVEEATTTPEPEDELADTGVGWGLVVFSAIGLGALVIVARRLRMAS